MNQTLVLLLQCVSQGAFRTGYCDAGLSLHHTQTLEITSVSGRNKVAIFLSVHNELLRGLMALTLDSVKQ